MSSEPLRTRLYDWHVAHKARMVDFAGWSMPVQYRSITEEHRATRTAVGVFDISHMGRLRFEGPGAVSFLEHLLTRRVESLGPGKVRYCLVTNEQGGILDDVLVYHLHSRAGESFYMLVVNASNRQKIVSWVQRHLGERQDLSFTDETLDTAMIAVQGPQALKAAQSVVAAPLEQLNYYTGVVTEIGQSTGIVSRTGYTGEDGCELIIPADAAVAVWEGVLKAGAASGALPAGLGARDTLRLEAAMPLYGHELSESINPFEAGLGFAVHLEGRDFPGRDVLASAKQRPPERRRVGLELAGRRVPREHYGVLMGDQVVGEVTSGTFSPTLERPIAMAYVRPHAAGTGNELDVDLRGRREPARVVELPFYRRPST